jgi:hypothetical protein
VDGSAYVVLRHFGKGELYTSVGAKLFVTFRFVSPFHLIQGITSGRTGRLKLPVTSGTTEALKSRAANPFQPARHVCIIAPACTEQNTAAHQEAKSAQDEGAAADR